MDNMNMHQNSSFNQYDLQNQQQNQYQQQNNNNAINLTKIDDNLNSSANIMAGISLACIIGSRLASIVVYAISILLTEYIQDGLTFIFTFMSVLLSIGNMAGLVLMIITRIKYPNNKLGKVAMWLYIALTIVELVATIICAVACATAGAYMINSCNGASW